MFNDDQIELLKKTIAKGASDDELSLFVNQCKRTGLDPFTRQIYFMKDKGGKVTIVTSIDGFRLIADRSNKYQGQREPLWCGADGVWTDVWLSDQPPKAAKVGVWKEGFKEPTYAIAIFEEYCGRYGYDDSYGKYKKGDLTFMWQKMPALMIAKVAEALALRKAFPNDLSGIYSTEEAQTFAEEPKEKKEFKPAKEQIAATRDPHIFEGGKFSGKKFSEVPQNEFVAELAKYEAVETKTAKLQSLIDRMKEYASKLEKSQMDELDKKLGII